MPDSTGELGICKRAFRDHTCLVMRHPRRGELLLPTHERQRFLAGILEFEKKSEKPRKAKPVFVPAGAAGLSAEVEAKVRTDPPYLS